MMKYKKNLNENLSGQYIEQTGMRQKEVYSGVEARGSDFIMKEKD
jgi:predicted XRE-type DNA-binding protein